MDRKELLTPQNFSREVKAAGSDKTKLKAIIEKWGPFINDLQTEGELVIPEFAEISKTMKALMNLIKQNVSYKG